MKEMTDIVKDTVKRIKRLGTFSSDTLGKGYSKKDHEDELTSLLVYIGTYFPIPILEMALKTMRTQLANAKKTIQEQMLSAEVEKFSMNGIDFDIKTVYTPEFPLGPDNEPDKQPFYDWCIDNNRGQVVKSTIKINDYNEAQHAKDALIEAGIHNIDIKREVHHKTLEAMINEMVRENEAMPPQEIMSVQTFDILVMKNGK